MEVEDGVVIWSDRPPTPDPKEAIQESLDELQTKVDNLTKQTTQLLDMMSKMQSGEAGGSKAGKKKKTAKAKELKE